MYLDFKPFAELPEKGQPILLNAGIKILQGTFLGPFVYTSENSYAIDFLVEHNITWCLNKVTKSPVVVFRSFEEQLPEDGQWILIEHNGYVFIGLFRTGPVNYIELSEGEFWQTIDQLIEQKMLWSPTRTI